MADQFLRKEDVIRVMLRGPVRIRDQVAPDSVTAVRAAFASAVSHIPSVTPPSPTVPEIRPLVWRDCADGTSHDEACRYEIEKDGMRWRLRRAVTGGTSYICHRESREAAKAAAQKYHEAQVLSDIGIGPYHPTPLQEAQTLLDLATSAPVIVEFDTRSGEQTLDVRFVSGEACHADLVARYAAVVPLLLESEIAGWTDEPGAEGSLVFDMEGVFLRGTDFVDDWDMERFLDIEDLLDGVDWPESPESVAKEEMSL